MTNKKRKCSDCFRFSPTCKDSYGRQCGVCFKESPSKSIPTIEDDANYCKCFDMGIFSP